MQRQACGSGHLLTASCAGALICRRRASQADTRGLAVHDKRLRRRAHPRCLACAPASAAWRCRAGPAVGPKGRASPKGPAVPHACLTSAARLPRHGTGLGAGPQAPGFAPPPGRAPHLELCPGGEVGGQAGAHGAQQVGPHGHALGRPSGQQGAREGRKARQLTRQAPQHDSPTLCAGMARRQGAAAVCLKGLGTRPDGSTNANAIQSCLQANGCALRRAGRPAPALAFKSPRRGPASLASSRGY